jgi:hypothetical protein
VLAAFPSWWQDDATPKPRLMLVHGELDDSVSPLNLTEAVSQWTDALQIDEVPDNAALGEPDTLGDVSASYQAYARGGELAVAAISIPGIGHGTPVDPGTTEEQGGHDPVTSTVALDCSPILDPACEQDWTNTAGLYGPFEAARFFGLISP